MFPYCHHYRFELSAQMGRTRRIDYFAGDDWASCIEARLAQKPPDNDPHPSRISVHPILGNAQQVPGRYKLTLS